MGRKIFVCWLVIILLMGVGVSFAEQPAGENENKVSSKETVTIFSEDFEGDFPGTTWTVGDANSASGDDYWGISDYKYHGGSKSCWCAQVGDIYGTPNYQLHSYDYYMSAYMDVNVDMSEYSSVNLTFWYWTQLSSLYDYDLLYVNTSSDGVSWTYQVAFYGISYGWKEYTIPLSSDTITIRFELYSYVNNYYGWEGAYIDDITITGNKAVITGSVSGTVTSGCNLLNNTFVTAYYACNNTQAGNDTTDENGDYIISNLLEGTYNVTASKVGYFSNTTTSVDVVAGQETENINFNLTPVSTAGTISGRVTIDTNPLSGATVIAKYICNGTTAGSNITDINGEYIISNLPGETYNVTASKSGYTEAYQVVALSAGEAKSNIDFNLSLTPTVGAITGHVYISGTTTGIQNANVSINASCYAITDTGGFYTLLNVTPDILHTITASATGYTSSFESVTVTAGEVKTQDFYLTLLSETGNITGIVTADGTALNNATITVEGTGLTAQTNVTGHYTISNISAGTYNVTASKSGYVSSTQTNVSVIAKNTTELNFVLTVSVEEQRGSISGTIKDKNGAPVAFATVKAYYANNTIAGETTTNSTGGYKLSNLLPGTYTVNVSKAGFQEYSTSATVGANQTVTKNAELTSETGGEGAEGEGGAEGADLSSYWWIAVVIAVIIVVVLVVLRRRIPAGRRIPAPREEFTREEMPPVREEFAPEKPVGKRFCIKCGREISKTAGFCPYCGYRFKK